MRFVTRLVILTIVGLFATSLVATGAFADPLQGQGQGKHKGKGKNKDKGKHKSKVVVVQPLIQGQSHGRGRGHGHAGGPPPWAPAHGYRSHKGG